MNEKMKAQIAAMKEQTIGVEVEMNSITRRSAAKVAAEFFDTDAARILPTATATAPGPPGTPRAASGSFSGTAASTVRTMRSARW